MLNAYDIRANKPTSLSYGIYILVLRNNKRADVNMN